MTYYAKSKPKETIMEHTNILLENLKVLKNIYSKDIERNKDFVNERFWYLLEIICKYHDIGKVYTPFQNIIRQKLGEKIIETEFSYEKVKHEQLSPMFVPVEKLGLTEDEKVLVYQAIYYHHERENKEISKEYIRRIIEKDVYPNIDKIKQELKIDIREKIDERYVKYIGDRITEHHHLYKKIYPEYCMLKGLLHRLDHSSSAEIAVENENGQVIEKCTEEFMEDHDFHKNELQEFSQKNQNKNLLIIGSTGIGKTESALLWSKNSKTFFTLPIRVSINAIYDRISENMGYTNLGLLHSTALDYLEGKQKYEDEEEIYGKTRNLYYKITTCTIDQIFPFVFKYKGYEKMYSTLGYSKVIIDEVQAYSPDIVAIILTGLQKIYQLGGQFMVMTATLPRIYKEELEKMNIEFEYKKEISKELRHKIRLEDKEIIEDIDSICEKSKNKKVLVIANTVKKAIEIYTKIKENGGENVNLLHSRFIQKDRSDKENRIKEFSNEKENHGIWISTQIVEASLDIDFDYLYTEMSTLDSLFQRLGRCYRKREYKENEPNIYIYTQNASGIGEKSVYNEQIHQNSIKLLKEYNEQILDEETKVKLVDVLYSKEMLEDTDFYKDFKAGIRFLKNIVDYETDKEQAQEMLRNIDNTTVIPKTVYETNINLFEEYQRCKDYKEKQRIKREINKLTVSVGISKYSKHSENITKISYMPNDNIFIADFPYDKDRGLILEETSEGNTDKRFL